MKSCAIYCRYSSESQRDSMSIEAQKRSCLEYAAKNGFTVHKTYVDEARSGTSDDRAAFQEMITDATGPDSLFQTLIIHKLDRFARNRYDSVQYKHILRKKGINVISVSQPMLGSGDPTEVLLESLLEGMDEFYSLNLARESLKGMSENARAGYWNGGRPPFGYRILNIKTAKGEKRKLSVDPAESNIVKRIYNLYLSGAGATKIRNILNDAGQKMRSRVFRKQIVIDILRSEKYCGDVIFGKRINKRGRAYGVKFDPIVVRDSHVPIIDRASWDKVQKILSSRSVCGEHPRSVESDFLLSGLLQCSLCDSKMIGKSGTSRLKKRFRYYLCQSVDKQGPKACSQVKFNADDAEFAVIGRIKEHLTTRETIEAFVESYNEALKKKQSGTAKDINRLQTEIATIQDRINRLIQAVETGKVGFDSEDIAPRIRELKAQKSNLDKELIQAVNFTEKPLVMTQEQTISAWTELYASFLENAALWQNKAFLKTVINRIEIGKDSASLYLCSEPPEQIPLQELKKKPRNSGSRMVRLGELP